MIQKMHINKTPDCCICKKKCFMSGVSIPLIALNEKGEIVDAFTNEQESASLIVPLCSYHMVLAQNGLIMTDGKMIICQVDPSVDQMSTPAIKARIKELEKRKDAELLKDIIAAGKVILEAREFENAMELKR